MNAHLKVCDNDNATYVSQIDDRATNVYAWFGLSSDASNALSLDTIRIQARVRLEGTWTDDTLQLFCQITDSSDVGITNEVMLGDASTMTGSFEDVDYDLPVLDGTPAAWAGNKCKFRWFYNKSKGADGIAIHLVDIDLPGTYTADTNNNVDVDNLVQQSAITEGAVAQEHNLPSESISQRSEIEPSTAVQEYDLISEHISQQSAIQFSEYDLVYELDVDNLIQQSQITQGTVELEHNPVVLHLVQQGEIQQPSVIQYVRVSLLVEIVSDGNEHTTVVDDLLQQSEIQQGEIHLEQNLISEHLEQLNVVEISSIHVGINLIPENIVQQSEIQDSQISIEHNALIDDLVQQSAIEQANADIEHNLNVLHLQQQSEVQNSVIFTEGSHGLVGTNVVQQSEIQESAITFDYNLVSEHIQATPQVQLSSLAIDTDLEGFHIAQQSGMKKGYVSQTEAGMKTTTVQYKHPYCTLYWEHMPVDGAWQDASNLSGYVSGQGTKTLTLESATPSETGFLRCTLSNPAGAFRYTDTVSLTGAATIPEFVVHPQDLEITETQTPFSFTNVPEDLTLWDSFAFIGEPDNLLLTAS